jgi:hypothetical protein
MGWKGWFFLAILLALVALAIVALVNLFKTRSAKPTVTPTDDDTEDNLGYLNFANLTDVPITIWLDDFAPCQRNKPDCSWENTDVTDVYLRKADGSKEQLSMTRKRDLEPAERWSIKIPIDPTTQMPVWCDGANCPGTGGWVTTKGVDMPAPERVMRFELNFNADSVWYNLSAVDGLNANMILKYTGCPDKETAVTISLDNCPWSSTVQGQRTCPAPKFPPGCDPEKMITIADVTKSECDWAGCGYDSEPIKCRCHYFWKTNENAIKWTDYILNNPDGGRADLYTWAYGEKTMNTNSQCCEDVKDCCDYPIDSLPQSVQACCAKDPDNHNCCQIDPCLVDTEPNPLNSCMMTPGNIGSLNIWITNIKS